MENKKVIINVGRQLGAGGVEIAKMLAYTFHASFYDKELLSLAAQESGFSPHFFEENDEQRGFLRSLFHLHTAHLSDNSFYPSDFTQERLFEFQCAAIRKAADAGSCVFVGRCADYVLRDRHDTVNIFITANLEDRLKRICDRQGLLHGADARHPSKDCRLFGDCALYASQSSGKGESCDFGSC